MNVMLSQQISGQKFYYQKKPGHVDPALSINTNTKY